MEARAPGKGDRTGARGIALLVRDAPGGPMTQPPLQHGCHFGRRHGLQGRINPDRAFLHVPLPPHPTPALPEMPCGEPLLIPGAQLCGICGTGRGARAPNVGGAATKKRVDAVRHGVPQRLGMEVAPPPLEEIMIRCLRGGRADPFAPRMRPEAQATQEQPTLPGRLIESHAGARVHAMRGQPPAQLRVLPDIHQTRPGPPARPRGFEGGEVERRREPGARGDAPPPFGAPPALHARVLGHAGGQGLSRLGPLVVPPSPEGVRGHGLCQGLGIRVPCLGTVAGEVLFRLPLARRPWHPALLTAEALAQRLEAMERIRNALEARVALRVGRHHGCPRVRGDDPSQGDRGLCALRALLTAGLLPQPVPGLHDRLRLGVVGLQGYDVEQGGDHAAIMVARRALHAPLDFRRARPTSQGLPPLLCLLARGASCKGGRVDLGCRESEGGRDMRHETARDLLAVRGKPPFPLAIFEEDDASQAMPPALMREQTVCWGEHRAMVRQRLGRKILAPRSLLLGGGVPETGCWCTVALPPDLAALVGPESATSRASITVPAPILRSGFWHRPAGASAADWLGAGGHPALQGDALEQSGCTKGFPEVARGAPAARPARPAPRASRRAGATLVVGRLERLGRALGQWLAGIPVVPSRQGGCQSLVAALDTTTATGPCFFQITGALAELARHLIRERTRAGLASARQRGPRGGRPQAMAAETFALAVQRSRAQTNSVQSICPRLGIARRTF